MGYRKESAALRSDARLNEWKRTHVDRKAKEKKRRKRRKMGCCGIIVFTVWELIAIVAGLIALATNAWIMPNSAGTACLLGVQGAGLWTVCTGKGTAIKDCSQVLQADQTNATQTGENILNQLESIPDQIQSTSSWIFTSDDECTPISDQAWKGRSCGLLPLPQVASDICRHMRDWRVRWNAHANQSERRLCVERFWRVRGVRLVQRCKHVGMVVVGLRWRSRLGTSRMVRHVHHVLLHPQ